MNNSISQHRGALNSYDENIDSKYGTSEAQETDVGKLQTELRDTKEKLWTISQKFSLLRKERDTLKKENKDLQEEIMMMQNNMREMIPGFSNILHRGQKGATASLLPTEPQECSPVSWDTGGLLPLYH